MVQDDNIAVLRQGLKDIYDEASVFFERNTSIERHGFTPLLIERDYYWSKISEADQKIAITIEEKLIRIMAKFISAAKISPLINEADQRDLSTNLKKMRAALHLCRYWYKDAEILHDEGTVLGVSPAQQSEDQAIVIDESRRIFDDSYAKISRILDLIIPGSSNIASVIVSSQRQTVAKYRQNTAFIMMWMDKAHPELEDVRDTIRSVCDSFGIRAIRADDIEHEDVITQRILDEIATSEFLIADLTGERPSVYYEIGYAHALGKRVILYRKKGTPLHFDLAVYNCPEYENLGDLKKKLENRFQHLTNKKLNR